MTLYRTILADPPWSYRQRLGRGKGAGHTTRGGLPYQGMSLEEIQGLGVANLADRDAMLWLWATNSHLHDALHVMEAWGFRYISTVTWAKRQFGLGYWLRGQTEHLLFGIKGNPRGKMKGPNGASGHSYSTLVETEGYITDKVGPHSSKPQVFIDLVETLGEPPRIELFARQRRMGWDVWGRDVGSDVDLGAIDVTPA